MIKIKKLPKPVELTDETVKLLIEEYKMTKKSVWKQTYIEKALLESSHSKCVYCECKINEESKYMEVEHYFDKSSNPDLVVEWNNLLPSCKRCNGHKSSHDTKLNPIVNPATMDPREHLRMKSFRYQGRTTVGKETIEVLLLNDTTRLVLPRFKISQAVIEQIEELLNKCRNYIQEKSTRSRNRIVQISKKILLEAAPSSEYAATVATEICNNDSFEAIIDILKSELLWDQELDNLWRDTQQIALLINEPLNI